MSIAVAISSFPSAFQKFLADTSRAAAAFVVSNAESRTAAVDSRAAHADTLLSRWPAPAPYKTTSIEHALSILFMQMLTMLLHVQQTHSVLAVDEADGREPQQHMPRSTA